MDFFPTVYKKAAESVSLWEMKSEPKILFLVAHPDLAKSRANLAVVQAVADLPQVTVHRLYDLYPYFHISVAAEQALLLQHDLLVIQHPLYWYSMPPLLKMWLDEVFTSGWAYGPGGDKLRGKDFLLSITAGGRAEGYTESGSNRFSIDTLLSPWNQTAHLCHMHWHKPFVMHAAIQAEPEKLLIHGRRVREALLHYDKTGSLP